MREEVLSSHGSQDTDLSGYELSDLEDFEVSWEDSAVDMDSVYRPEVDTPFSPSIFDVVQIGLTAANPIIVDDEEDKENSTPTTTTRTPKFERPTAPPRLLRSPPFGKRLKMYLTPSQDSVLKNFVCI